MSGYDRHGASRDPHGDPRGDRGGYYRRDDSRPGAWDGAPRDHHDDGYSAHHREPPRRDHDRGYGGPSRRDSYPPRDGYGAGGPDRGDPGYGRFAPYDRGPGDRYRENRDPPPERYGGYDRRDAYDRPPIADPPGSPSRSAPRAPRGPVTGAYRSPPRARTTGTGTRRTAERPRTTTDTTTGGTRTRRTAAAAAATTTKAPAARWRM
jgi:hypothetical protein